MGNQANVNVTIQEPPKAARRFANGDEILGRYVVQSELGQGGMGVVYKCFDKVGGVEVAVKGLPPEVSHNSDEMEAVRENFQLVSELHHPNIAGVRTLEKDSTTGDYYLVMTLARGVSLRHWLRQHGGKEHRAVQLNVLRQIASALDYAHNAEPKHIIHRDIKPENIMVDDGGHVMVLDFGLAAQVRSSLSRVSLVVTSRSGTPAYKSPEQWLAQAQRATSDQYSLGVIAYQMFAGELPFDSDDLEILKHAVVFDPVPAIPSEDKDINAVFVKSLEKKPQDRFTSCAAFIDALVGKDHPVRSAVRMRIAVALLGVLAVAGGWWAWKSQNDAAKPRQNEIARQLEGVRRESEKLQLGEVKQQGERIAEDRRRTEKEVDSEDALSAGSKAEIGRVVAEKRIVEEAEVAVSKAETETHYLADPRPGEFYQVQPGDTIYGIAKKAYGKISGWKKIRTANKALISSDNRVSPGWRIFIPNEGLATATEETNSCFSVTNKATRIQEYQSEAREKSGRLIESLDAILREFEGQRVESYELQTQDIAKFKKLYEAGKNSCRSNDYGRATNLLCCAKEMADGIRIKADGIRKTIVADVKIAEAKKRKSVLLAMQVALDVGADYLQSENYLKAKRYKSDGENKAKELDFQGAMRCYDLALDALQACQEECVRKMAAIRKRTLDLSGLPRASGCIPAFEKLFSQISTATAVDVYVKPSEDLKEIIERAQERTTIHLRAGTYEISGTQGLCKVSNKVRLVGEGRMKTIIKGRFEVGKDNHESSSLLLKQLTLESGGDLVVYSCLFLDDVVMNCPINGNMYSMIVGRNVRQEMVAGSVYRNKISCKASIVMQNSTIKGGGWDIYGGGMALLDGCVVVGDRDGVGKRGIECFRVIGEMSRYDVPICLFRCNIAGFGTVFCVPSSCGAKHHLSANLNVVEIRKCDNIVKNAEIESYGLVIYDCKQEFAVNNRSKPIDLPSGWK